VEAQVVRIGVLGDEGFLGGLVAEELRRRGHVAVPLGGPAAVDDLRSLTPVVADCALVISALGRRELTRRVLDVAVAGRTHLVDPVGDPGTMRWAGEEGDAVVRDAGITVVLAAGLGAVPGDPLAHLATHAVTSPSEVHVCYAFPSAGNPLRAASGGTRRALAAWLGDPATSLVDGGLVHEVPGETRRLAWFPRPVGPVHAVGVPGAEPFTVPRHAPSVRTVRTYLALSSWRAELLQASGWAAGRPAGRRLLADRLSRRGGPQTRARREASRWACVAETAGREGIARAWAYGTDPYGTSAASLVALAESVLAGHADAGVVPPSLAELPEDLLDGLSARTDLKWSVSRPPG
jgi:hypothetical protein